MIKYINITYQEYDNLSEEESKKPYCIEYVDGDKDWVVNDKLHREDGPAEIFEENCYWSLNGKYYSFEEFIKITPISDEEKILLKLKYS